MAGETRAPGLRAARQAYLRADYDMCVSELRARRGVERDLLLARAYLRMRRNAEAERVLRLTQSQERSSWAALMGAAIARQGDSAGAKPLLEKALATARDDEERAEAWYQRALLYWMDKENDEADAILRRENFGSVNGRAEELRGWISVGREDYEGAIRHFERAAALSGGDVRLETNALRNASVYAREMYMPAVMSSVLHRVEHIARTPYVENNLYHIMRAAAWFAAIEGDYMRAMQGLRASAQFFTEGPWRVYTLCDQAYLSLVLGEEVNGWVIAEQALEESVGIDWDSYRENEHMALLYLSNIFAIRRPIEAQRCWRRYKSVPPPDPLRGTLAREPHIQAWEAYTAGLLEKSSGELTAAAADFNRAYSLYRKIGFEWRAVLTLLAQRDVVPEDPSYEAYIDKTLRRFPNSWLQRLVELEKRRRAPATVTPIAKSQAP